MTGTPPILATAAVEEGTRLLLEAGIGPMRAKSTQLTSYLIDLADACSSTGLRARHAPAARPPRRSRHLLLSRAEQLVSELAAGNVIADYAPRPVPARPFPGLPPASPTSGAPSTPPATSSSASAVRTMAGADHGGADHGGADHG